MTVVVAPDRLAPAPRPGIFLAGAISGTHDWHSDAIRHLAPAWPVIYNPRRPEFPMGDRAAGVHQIRWEYEHLRRADTILFWFSFETVAPIALFELGCWSASTKPLVVGAHPGYARRFDVVEQLALVRPGLRVHESLESACLDANALDANALAGTVCSGGGTARGSDTGAAAG